MIRAMRRVCSADLTSNMSVAPMVKYLTRKLFPVKRSPLRTARSQPTRGDLLSLGLSSSSRTTGP